MTEAFEILCDVCGKPAATEAGLKQHITKMHGKKEEGELIDPTPFDEEIRPVPIDEQYEDLEGPLPKKGWRDKLWGTPGGDPKPFKPSVVEKRPRKRRTSTEGVWQAAWTVAGMALVRTGADIPVGNCLQFQAPIVGDILDEAIQGTFLDTLLQPIAGKGKRMKKVSNVIAMPLIVGAMERSPNAAPVLEPLLRQAIREHLVAMAPVIKAQQKQEADYRKALGELGMDADGNDPIDAVIEAIFPQLSQVSADV